MLTNAFTHHPHAPTKTELSAALGATQSVWNDFLTHLARESLTTTQEWKCHSPKWGWSLRVLQGQRTIVWLSPGRGGFNVTFILGDRAVASARAARLPQTVRTALATALRYPEGTALRLVVKSPRALPALRRLAALKAAH
ncbi:MAG: DUF3788 family protein [Candidatus Didemnitutus sp.]|nr:DUF3788 family protein [Candidatus Didemnitutus sp.]